MDSDADLRRLLREWKTSGGTGPLAAAIADAYQAGKSYTEARHWYRKAVAFTPADSALRDRFEDSVLRGLELLLHRDSPDQRPSLKLLYARCRIESFERRVKEHPSDAGLRFELGRVYYIMNQIDQAMAEFAEVLRSEPRRILAFSFMAKCLMRKRDFPAALLHIAAFEERATTEEQRLDARYMRDHCK